MKRARNIWIITETMCIVKLMNDNVFGEEVLGNEAHEMGEDLII